MVAVKRVNCRVRCWRLCGVSSAGIGRTGCFIAISIAIQQQIRERAVDILAIVSNLRLDRSSLSSFSLFMFVYFLLTFYRPNF